MMELACIIAAALIVAVALAVIGRRILAWWPIMCTLDRTIFCVSYVLIVCGAISVVIGVLRTLE